MKKMSMIVNVGVKTPYNKLDEWQQQANHYTCTLKYNHKQLTTSFFTGRGWTKEPTWKDVLHSLLMDKSCYDSNRNFEEFCNDLGYDSDSRKALSIYKACERISKRLERFLGDDIKQFEEMLSEY